MEHVFVTGWELQCCGEPFGVGSDVSWGITEGGWGDSDPLGPLRPPGLVFEAHHHETDERVVGRVRSLSAVFFRYAHDPARRALRPVGSSAVLEPTREADPWVGDRGGPGQGGLRFTGYLAAVEGTRQAAPVQERRTKAGPHSR